MSQPSLAELYADAGPADDPYCTNCWGFGLVKEDSRGYRADMGWIGCPVCGGRQRRTAEVVSYNEAFTREKKYSK